MAKGFSDIRVGTMEQDELTWVNLALLNGIVGVVERAWLGEDSYGEKVMFAFTPLEDADVTPREDEDVPYGVQAGVAYGSSTRSSLVMDKLLTAKREHLLPLAGVFIQRASETSRTGYYWDVVSPGTHGTTAANVAKANATKPKTAKRPAKKTDLPEEIPF